MKINPFLKRIRILLFTGLFLFFSCTLFEMGPRMKELRSDKNLSIELPSNLGQGYQWQLLDTSQFSVIQHSSRSNPDSSISTDLEKLVLQPKVKKGKFILVFYSRRPFDPMEDTANSSKIYRKIILR